MKYFKKGSEQVRGNQVFFLDKREEVKFIKKKLITWAFEYLYAWLIFKVSFFSMSDK